MKKLIPFLFFCALLSQKAEGAESAGAAGAASWFSAQSAALWSGAKAIGTAAWFNPIPAIIIVVVIGGSAYLVGNSRGNSRNPNLQGDEEIRRAREILANERRRAEEMKGIRGNVTELLRRKKDAEKTAEILGDILSEIPTHSEEAIRISDEEIEHIIHTDIINPAKKRKILSHVQKGKTLREEHRESRDEKKKQRRKSDA